MESVSKSSEIRDLRIEITRSCPFQLSDDKEETTRGGKRRKLVKEIELSSNSESDDDSSCDKDDLANDEWLGEDDSESRSWVEK